MRPLVTIVLCAGLGVAAYAAFRSGSPSVESEVTAKRVSVPGWDQLDTCSPMQSLDDTKELTFLEDHTVNILEREAKTLRELGPSTAAGTWAFDESAERYFVTLSQQRKSYILVHPEDSGVCILASGEIAAANIGESWFSRIAEDADDDHDPDDRY
jgi:hypothetical protein